jgi:hypothetical protein
MTKSIGTGLLMGLGGLVVVAALAVLSGTILFWIWEPAVAPFIEQGVTWLPTTLLWKEAVLLTWVFGILIKATQTNTSTNI